MADDPQKVEIDVEADASATVRSSRAAAAALNEVIASAAKLEVVLRQIFTGQAPRELEKFTRSLQLAQQLPAQMAQISRTSRNLASGGPVTSFQNAALTGVINTIRTDPALQLLKIERETNKALEARAQIYRRLKQVMPGASDLQMQSAYRRSLISLGDRPGEDPKAWLAKTRAEVRKFNDDLLKEQDVFNTKRITAEQRVRDRLFTQQEKDRRRQRAAEEKETQDLEAWKLRVRLNSIAAANRAREKEDRRTLAEARAEFNAAYSAAYKEKSQREKADRDRFDATYKQAWDENRARDQDFRWDFRDANEENRERDRLARQEKARRDRLERQEAQRAERNSPASTAGRFGFRAELMRDYVAMGSLLAGMSFGARSTVEMESALKQLQAISQATDIELKALESTIYRVGQSTKYSTKEIADAATVMAQAGYSARQIDEALPAIAQLATGAGASLQDAVNITTSVLSVFDMSIDRTSQVTNQLAQALNGSKLSLEQLSLGVQYAGNIAADGGVQFEELTAALGAMANAGIKSGSTLGTGLRSLIQEMEEPSDKFREQLLKLGLTAEDVDIRTQGLYGALLNLREAGFRSSDAMNSFEIRAASAFSALTNNLDVLSDLQTEMADTNAATEAANVQMGSLAAVGVKVGNSFTHLSSVGGAKLMEALKIIGNSLAAVLTAATHLGPAVQILTNLLAALAITSAGKFLLTLASGFLGAGTAASGAAVGVRAFTVALLANPLTWWTAGVALLIQLLGSYSSSQADATLKAEQAATAANGAAAEQQRLGSQISEVNNYIEILVTRHESLSKNTHLAGQAAETAMSKFAEYGLQLDTTGTHVDGLIGKLVELRGELAAAALEQARVERGALVQQRDALTVAGAPDRGASKLSAMGLLNGNASTLRQIGAYDLMKKYTSGELSSGESLQLQQLLRKNEKLFPKTGMTDRVGAVIGALSNPNASKIAQLDRRIGRLDETIGTNTLLSSAGVTQAGVIAGNWRTVYDQQDRDVARMQDPVARNNARAALQRERSREWQTRFGAPLEQLADDQLKDPAVRAAAERMAARMGISPREALVQQILSSDENLGRLNSLSRGGVTSNNAKVLQQQSSRLAAEIADAKKAKDMGRVRDLSAQKKEVDARLLAARNPDADPIALEQMLTENGLASDARLSSALRPGSGSNGANRAARAAARTKGREVTAQERRIEIGQGNGLATDALAKMVDDWEALKKAQIRLDADATGASADDLEDRLTAFEVEAKEYRDKVINGTIQQTKDILAAQADRAASDIATGSASRLRLQGGNLEEALQASHEAYDEALKKAIEASDESFRAKGLDPNIAPDAVERRIQLTRDFAQKTIRSSLDQIQAWMAGETFAQNQRFDAADIHLARQQAQINALSNFYGSRQLSDVQRGLGAIRGEELAIAGASNEVDRARGAYDTASGAHRQLTGLLSTTTDPAARAELTSQIAQAAQDAQATAVALQNAEIALGGMTAQAPTFASYSEAIRSAWQVYVDQTMMARPVIEQISDGLMGVFDNANSSFRTFFNDVLTGTQSLKGAFKDLTSSILQSFMDMLTQLLAQKLLMWVMGMFMPGSAGTGTSIGTSGAIMNAANGGRVPGIPRNYAAGGKVIGGIPNRDSVLGNLMPGEVIMSKSAVDMVGEKTLLNLNAMGNRRLSEMASVPMSAAGDSGEVNVWIVKDEARPVPGKRDIVAAIAEDILTGGETKKLIKSVARG